MPMIFVNGNDGGTILPAPEGTCPECAVKHVPEMPHNQQSLHFQYRFRQKTGRWPTWADAMAHCSPEMKAAWEQELRAKGAWSEPAKPGSPILKKGTVENTLAQVEGTHVEKELPEGAPIPPLMKVTTVRIRAPRKKAKARR